MKIRNGFVSNSSSSSFCIYGIRGSAGIEDVKKFQKAFPDKFKMAVDKLRESKYESEKSAVTILEKLGNEDYFKDITARGCDHAITVENAKFCPECGKSTWITIENPSKKELARLNDAEFCARIMGLGNFGGGEMGDYLGRSWASIGDNETGAEFKKSVDDILMITDGKKGSTIKEAWFDG